MSKHNSTRSEDLARLADAEERIADLESKLDARDAEIARLQRENGNLAFLNSCLQDDVRRLRPKPIGGAVQNASNDELKPTKEVLEFLGGGETNV